MTLEPNPDRRGRIVRTGDLRQPLALVDDDGTRLTDFDAFLQDRTPEVAGVTLVGMARALLHWQRYLWSPPATPTLLPHHQAAVRLQAAGYSHAYLVRFVRFVTEYLDFAAYCEFIEGEYVRLAAGGTSEHVQALDDLIARAGLHLGHISLATTTEYVGGPSWQPGATAITTAQDEGCDPWCPRCHPGALDPRDSA